MRNGFDETLKVALIPSAVPGSNFDSPYPWDAITMTSEQWWQQQLCIHHTRILLLSRFSVWYLIILCKFLWSRALIYQNLCSFSLGKLSRRQSLFNPPKIWWCSASLKKIVPPKCRMEVTTGKASAFGYSLLMGRQLKTRKKPRHEIIINYDKQWRRQEAETYM